MKSNREQLIPWIVVSAIAVVAIIIALVFVSSINATSNDAGEQTNDATPSTSKPVQGNTKPSTASTPTPSETDEPDTGEIPVVDPGATSELGFAGWNVTGQLSTKLGATSFTVNGDVMNLDSELPRTLPASCATAQSGWGISRSESKTATNTMKVGDAYFGVVKPAESCSENKALFNEIWGLYGAYLKSLKAS
ncbi:hypothetical protein [Lysinibacter cavernae]|uniref:Cytoskeletal protein RodZ n=1 Tax=Lysinibacter cavernae TaxID=1640652 RepID=A0A7X5TRK1_9MICO|nr:hypothetical protein [Lysinibacter cavernae]NIH52296.1 cytoskeletal protein RodZ [Lysinibacter cavernae]